MDLDRAWFDLSQGQSVRAITDQNGERIEYTGANSEKLLEAIRKLAPLCPSYKPLALGTNRTPRPLRFWF